MKEFRAKSNLNKTMNFKRPHGTFNHNTGSPLMERRPTPTLSPINEKAVR